MRSNKSINNNRKAQIKNRGEIEIGCGGCINNNNKKGYVDENTNIKRNREVNGCMNAERSRSVSRCSDVSFPFHSLAFTLPTTLLYLLSSSGPILYLCVGPFDKARRLTRLFFFYNWKSSSIFLDSIILSGWFLWTRQRHEANKWPAKRVIYDWPVNSSSLSLDDLVPNTILLVLSSRSITDWPWTNCNRNVCQTFEFSQLPYTQHVNSQKALQCWVSLPFPHLNLK